MAGSVRFTAKSATILRAAGLTTPQITREKTRYQEASSPKPHKCAVKFTERLRQGLFHLNIDPFTTERIVKHLHDLETKYHVTDEDTAERLREHDRTRKRAERAENREEYNERQKLLMRERRQKAKDDAAQRSEHARKAANARWGTPPDVPPLD